MAAYLWHTTSCDTGRYDKTRRMSSSLSLEKQSTLVVRRRFSPRLESTASSSRDLFTILEESAKPCVLGIPQVRNLDVSGATKVSAFVRLRNKSSV